MSILCVAPRTPRRTLGESQALAGRASDRNQQQTEDSDHAPRPDYERNHVDDPLRRRCSNPLSTKV
jgi:hypothetical protein